MANCHELTLSTLPAFVRVASVAAATSIVLLWRIIALTGSANNLASIRAFLRTSISLSFLAQGLWLEFHQACVRYKTHSQVLFPSQCLSLERKYTQGLQN